MRKPNNFVFTVNHTIGCSQQMTIFVNEILMHFWVNAYNVNCTSEFLANKKSFELFSNLDLH